MPVWRNSWSEYAATTGFTVNPPRSLSVWYAMLAGLALLAGLKAPWVSMAGALALLPGLLIRGRLPVWPRRLGARHLRVDPTDANVIIRSQSGAISDWYLRSWFRHPRLIILYLHHPSRGYGCVVLPRDALRAADRRRLHYVLGVSTVGAGSNQGSGASRV